MEIVNIDNKPRRLLTAAMQIPGEEIIGNALVLNDRVLHRGYFTSVSIHRFEAETRGLGAEEITRDIPYVSEQGLEHLDEKGIAKLERKVKKRDILIGKIKYKRESELSEQEKLMRVIFGGELEIKNESVYMPYEEEGIVVGIGRKSASSGLLKKGILESAYVDVAIKRELDVGDVLIDKKGNKGVVLRFSPDSVLATGFAKEERKVDVIINPDSDFVDSFYRPQEKNIWYCQGNTIFLYGDNISKEWTSELIKNNYEVIGRAKVGLLTLEKLVQFANDKAGGRISGRYTLISEQPLWKDSPEYPRGSRISEEELSALKDYIELSREALTIRSDSVEARTEIYGELVKNG